jgi:alpha-L-rhamnosidase
MIVALLFVAALSSSAEQLAAPQHLRIEGLDEAVAILSEPAPRFSFVHPPVPDGNFGLKQASYRISVSMLVDDSTTSPVWDSGEVSSAATVVVYSGRPLTAFTRYMWTVEWASSAGEKSSKAVSRFETGPMDISDWRNATWLATYDKKRHLACFRFAFDLPKAVLWARAYIAAPGCHALEVNGRVPTPDLRGICPWVVGSQRAKTRYQTHDITSLLVKGKNALGVLAGHVMEADPHMLGIVMVQLEGEDTARFYSTASAGWLQTES